MLATDKMTVPVVKILPKKESNLYGQLSEKTYSVCSFCDKQVGLYQYEREIHDKLNGGDLDFYCNFCLRNQYNTKKCYHTLVMSFRGIIGFYYEYLYKEKNLISLSQVQDFVEIHKKTGMQCPVFNYDEDSMLWFIDFSRVGRGRKKVKLNDVLKTTINILACFNMIKSVPEPEIVKIYEKYRSAIEKYCSHRYRPADRFLLIPTLSDCCKPVYAYNAKKKEFNFEASRNFCKSKMVMVNK